MQSNLEYTGVLVILLGLAPGVSAAQEIAREVARPAFRPLMRRPVLYPRRTPTKARSAGLRPTAPPGGSPRVPSKVPRSTSLRLGSRSFVHSGGFGVVRPGGQVGRGGVVLSNPVRARTCGRRDGAGSLVSLDVVARVVPAGRTVGPELVLSDQAHQEYCSLLGNLEQYVGNMWDTVARRPALWADGPPRPPTAEEFGDALFGYACRLIGRRMPGYARTVKTRRGAGGSDVGAVSMVGDWTSAIDPREIAKEAGALAVGKPTTAGKPLRSGSKKAGARRQDLVEVCLITHPQLAETVRKDLRLWATASHRRGSAPLRKDPVIPPSRIAPPYTAVEKSLRNIMYRNRRPVARLERLVASLQRPGTAIDGLRRDLLDRDLGGYSKDLHGLNFQYVVRRLLGFYRKGAATRNFLSAKRRTAIHEAVRKEFGQVPPSATAEVTTQVGSTRERAAREGLRRAVDQFTELYEYNMLHKALSSRRELARLKQPFQDAEMLELVRFWHSCNEIRDICQAPRHPMENQACEACARRVVTSQCLDGAETKGGTKRCRGAGTLADWLIGQATSLLDGSLVAWFGNGRGRHPDADSIVAQRLLETRFFPAPVPDASTLAKSAIHSCNAFVHAEDGDKHGWAVVQRGLCVAKHYTGPTKLQRFNDHKEYDQHMAPFCDGSIHGGRWPHEARNVCKGALAANLWRNNRKRCDTWTGADGDGVGQRINACIAAAGGGPAWGRSAPRVIYDRVKALREAMLTARGAFSLTSAGWTHLAKLPLSEWQRCYLFNPPGSGIRCDDFKGAVGGGEAPFAKRMKALLRKSLAGPNAPAIHQTPLFRLVLADSTYRQRFGLSLRRFTAVSPVVGRGMSFALRALAQRALDPKAPAPEAGPDGPSVVSTITEGASPIVGALLGYLMQAAGLTEIMKTLAKAAGLTPEQGADCEDPEYRKDVLGLSRKSTKSDCLLKVVAKNFAGALESIIVLLGNKLVDWGVDMLRTALQAAKSASISAAGSVPFAGGFLAMMVDVLWELVFNFGAKAVLKGFVVANLPEWLGVRALAKIPLGEVLKNPVVRVVGGILLQFIQAAIEYPPQKSVLGALAQGGGQAFLSGIKLAIEHLARQGDKTANFFIRALIYAKRELVKGVKDGGGIADYFLALGSAMVGGICEVVARGLPPGLQSRYRKRVEALRASFRDGAALRKLLSGIAGSGGLARLGELFGKLLAPVLVPVIFHFVDAPPWLKTILNRLAARLFDDIDAATKGNFKPLGEGLIELVGELREPLLGLLPVGDAAIRKLVEEGLGLLARLGKQAIAGGQGWAQGLAAASVGILVGVAKEKLRLSAGLEPEGKLLASAVGALAELATNPAKRALLASGDTRKVLDWVAGFARPYLQTRLSLLAKEAGLPANLVSSITGLLASPKGPLLDASFRPETLGDGMLRLLFTFANASLAGAGPLVKRFVAWVLVASPQPPRTALDLLRGIAATLGVRVPGEGEAVFTKIVEKVRTKVSDHRSLGGLNALMDELERFGAKAFLAQTPAAALRWMRARLADVIRQIGAASDAGTRGLVIASILGLGLRLLEAALAGARKGGLRTEAFAEAWSLGLRWFSLAVGDRLSTLFGKAPHWQPFAELLRSWLDSAATVAAERLLGGQVVWRRLAQAGPIGVIGSLVGDVVAAAVEATTRSTSHPLIKKLLAGVLGQLRAILRAPVQFFDAATKAPGVTLIPVVVGAVRPFFEELLVEPLRERAGKDRETAPSLIVQMLLDGAMRILAAGDRRGWLLAHQPLDALKQGVASLLCGRGRIARLLGKLKIPVPRQIVEVGLGQVVSSLRLSCR